MEVMAFREKMENKQFFNEKGLQNSCLQAQGKLFLNFKYKSIGRKNGLY